MWENVRVGAEKIKKVRQSVLNIKQQIKIKSLALETTLSLS